MANKSANRYKKDFKIDLSIFKKALKKYKPIFRWDKFKKTNDEILCFASEAILWLIASQIAMILPGSHSVYKMEKNRDELLEIFSRWRLRNSQRYLKQQKIIKDFRGDYWRLTQKGALKAMTVLTEKLFIKIPQNWDRRWRIVVFDIPNEFENRRSSLRSYLKRLNFLNIQKSVWIFPFVCEKEIKFLSEILGVKNYIYLISGKISNDKEFIRHFKRIYPKVFEKTKNNEKSLTI